MKRNLASALLLVFAAACATTSQTPQNISSQITTTDLPTEVKIELLPNSQILVRYLFAEPIIGFKFFSDYTKYRAEFWQSLDPNIEIISNAHGLEIVKSKNSSLFSEVSFKVPAMREFLNTDYSPLVPYSNNEALIYPHQFSVVALTDLTHFAEWKTQIDFPFPGSQRVIVSSRLFKHGIFDGEKKPLPYDVTHLLGKDSPYIYVGNKSPSKNEKYVTIADDSVPSWVKKSLATNFARAMTFLTEKLSTPPRTPFLFITRFRTEATPKSRVRGEATKGIKTHTFALLLRGEGWENPTPADQEHLDRITVHEPIHIWNSPSVTDFAPIAWIYEGGADALRVRTELATQMRTPKRYEEFHEEAAARCLEHYVAPITLTTMTVLPTYNLVYACGMLIGLMTEQILEDKNLFSFWAELLARARAKGMKYGLEDYFNLLNERSSKKNLIAKIRSFVERPSNDRRQELIDLLRATGSEIKTEMPLKFTVPVAKY